MRVERTESEVLPPGTGTRVQCGHDDCAAGSLLVQFCGSGKHMGCESGPDPEVGVSAIHGEAAEKDRRDGIRRAFGERYGGG